MIEEVCTPRLKASLCFPLCTCAGGEAWLQATVETRRWSSASVRLRFPHTHPARSSAHGGPHAPLCLEAQHSFKTH